MQNSVVVFLALYLPLLFVSYDSSMQKRGGN